jgi:hypothetical protein
VSTTTQVETYKFENMKTIGTELEKVIGLLLKSYPNEQLLVKGILKILGKKR